MKIPAIKSKIGDWTYYVTTLTFKEVSDYVSKIDNQLHKSEGLKDVIQRSITDNHVRIKEYILKQPELFFNALVLAVYDDYPNWREIEFKYGDVETYKMGLLEFPSTHKIFPVDGQHRVEGIKEALLENESLSDQRIAAIFIGHRNDSEGQVRTRRLFTTLNRYAKPVSDDDIIALDEDDLVAITTRDLLEEYDLFTEKRVVYAKQKAIPSNNKDAITSIITLYQANIEILKYHYLRVHREKLTAKKLAEYLKFRPGNSELEAYQKDVREFWDGFKKLKIINDYLKTKESPASPFRNTNTGGNMVFRPIGFLPLVKSAIEIKRRTNGTFKQIFTHFNKINFNLDSKPWLFVLWNPTEKKMVMSSNTVTELMLIYLFDKRLLSSLEMKKLKEGYASKISIEDGIDNVLRGILTKRFQK